MDSKERIGVFGGTFDPVHNGHVSAASEAARKLGLSKLLFIPAANPPHKDLAEDAADAQMRIDMLKLAVRDIETAEVSDLEIRRGGVSYTVDTVKELKLLCPGAELWLLIGGDMLEYFESWRNFEWLCANIYICVLSRLAESGGLIKSAGTLSVKYGAKIVLAKNDAVEISSSELREMLKNRCGREYLNPDVYAYIIKNRLYKAKPDFDWLREKAKAMLDPKRVPHVLGCETEAIKLSRRWGADEDDARCAAILHDITKNLSLGEQLILCEKYGIIIDTAERQEVKLMHSITGAVLAEKVFGMPETVCEAIRWHTTGKAGMTLLEKIMYISDYIEPTRAFEGVEKIRVLAYSDLDAALLRGLEMTLAEITERGKTPHKNTLSAIEYLKRSVLAQ